MEREYFYTIVINIILAAIVAYIIKMIISVPTVIISQKEFEKKI